MTTKLQNQNPFLAAYSILTFIVRRHIAAERVLSWNGPTTDYPSNAFDRYKIPSDDGNHLRRRPRGVGSTPHRTRVPIHSWIRGQVDPEVIECQRTVGGTWTSPPGHAGRWVQTLEKPKRGPPECTRLRDKRQIMYVPRLWPWDGPTPNPQRQILTHEVMVDSPECRLLCRSSGRLRSDVQFSEPSRRSTRIVTKSCVRS